ncbi:hypothetical protein RHMOL_Rhmol03G0156400 [Rhododendron molle]|uniref:Uncharacterized protein n=1 Tax=Rhododendron molle TaxID=49168 RepID=A0ACC0PH35_RHOML|nr:hypothetical protein RHMOL_Rhmol03G0156400 [Rhododendron molle]
MRGYEKKEKSLYQKAESTYLNLLQGRCIPTEDTYALLVKAYCISGLLAKAEAVFAEMRKNGHPQISMPGMMDTVLNLGLNDEVVAALAAKSGQRFAYGSYRRFLDMFGDVVNVALYVGSLHFLSKA